MISTLDMLVMFAVGIPGMLILFAPLIAYFHWESTRSRRR